MFSLTPSFLFLPNSYSSFCIFHRAIPNCLKILGCLFIFKSKTLEIQLRKFIILIISIFVIILLLYIIDNSMCESIFESS